VSTSYLATYSYDDFSRRTNLAYANGATQAYTYTVAGDLLTLANTLNGASSNISYALGYTNAHELTSEGYSNAAYEAQPTNGTDTFGAVNSLNQYPSVTLAGQSAATLTYDANGNLTSDGTWTYAYDAENKLITAAAASKAVSAAYAYDPLGRRTEKYGPGVSTTLFLNDGSDEIAEYDGNGNVLRRFVPGPAINEPVVYENCAGATAPRCTGAVSNEYFHTDHHGSVVAMSGAGAAPVEGPYVYDSYGNGAPLTGVPFKFVGMYLDAETGLYYDRARYYSPTQGRFLQTDPIGYKDDLDMYTYVGNDPLDHTDPTGMCVEDACVGETAFVVYVAIPAAIATVGIITAIVNSSGSGNGNRNNGGNNSGPGMGHNGGPSMNGGPPKIIPPVLPSSGRGSNNLKPDPNAEGPHSTFRRDANGNVNHTATYTPNPQNPSGHDEVQRTDVTGGSYYNKATGQDVPTPHTHDPTTPGGVRPATPQEIPKPCIPSPGNGCN
jgi:RHS repeat-associated protein